MRVRGSSSSTIRMRAVMCCGFLFSCLLAERHARRRGSVPLGTLLGERTPFHHVVDGFSDVGRMVAHALDVLGAEQQMDAVADVARVLHHVGEELAEER